MHPVLLQFSLGGAEVILRAYATFLVLATVVAVGLAVRVAVGLGVEPRRAAPGFAAAVTAGLVGARLVSVILEPDLYAADPSTALALAPRGFALYGGFIGSGVALILLARHWGQSLARLADGLIAPLALGLVLVRIGCFLNGCCAGLSTDLPWGVVFPYGSSAWGQQVLGNGGAGALFGHVDAVHPTQLYEAAAALALAGVAVRLRGRGAPPGVPALLFAAAFLSFRVLNQALRAPTTDLVFPQPVLLAAYSVGALVAAAWLVRRWQVARPGHPSMRRSLASTSAEVG